MNEFNREVTLRLKWHYPHLLQPSWFRIFQESVLLLKRHCPEYIGLCELADKELKSLSLEIENAIEHI